MLKRYTVLFLIFILLNVIFSYIRIDFLTFLKGNTASSFLSFRYIIFSLIIIFFLYLIFFKIKNYNKTILIFISFICIINILELCYNYDIFNYIFNKTQTIDFYEKYYIDAKTADIKVPNNKKNLILIIAESLEFTFSNKDYFGENLIPELTLLAQNNLSFSNYMNGYGQNNTMMSFTAMMTGIPSNGIFIGKGENYFIMEQMACFLPKIYSVPKILKDNGYQTLLVQGSEAKFSGMSVFCKSHKFDKLFDLKKLIRKYSFKAIKNWWGLADTDTFEAFKKEILELDSKKPFFAVMFTTDTHYMGGIPADMTTVNIFKNLEYNIIRNSSFLIQDFLDWVNNQSFVKNTAVIIVGDHTRLGKFFDFNSDKICRMIYNVFINSEFKDSCINQNRTFSQVDLFPTILETIGFKIEGSRLGLGTSLFSDKQTLFEEFGEQELKKMLSKNNKLYKSLWKS